MFIKRVKELIEEYRLLVSGDRVLISHSGGMDSTVLLAILYILREEYQLDLKVFHLNHLFRQESARKDAEFVEEMASSLGIPCTIRVFDVPRYCQERGVGAQEGARTIRYELLNRVAEEVGANRIALGHHAGDQAETVLLNLLRGSGVEGLKGMEPLQGIYIRPLLHVTRQEIAAYCKKEGLPYREDPSNKKEIYLRNRLRLDLIPFIEENYATRFQEALVRMSTIVRDENTFIHDEARMAFQESLVEVEGDRLTLDTLYLQDLPKALLRRVLRQAYQVLAGSKAGLTFEQIEGIQALLEKGRWKLPLPGDMWVVKTYTTLIFTQRMGKMEEEIVSYHYRLPIPGEVEIPNQAMVVKAQEVEKALVSRIKEAGPATLSSLHRIYIDYHQVKTPLRVRNRKDGDVFYPLGMGGKKKIKDFLMDEKIDYQERDGIPIVTDDKGTIIWVVGLRMADNVKITGSTRRILQLDSLRKG